MWRKEESKPQGAAQTPSAPVTGFPQPSTNSAPSSVPQVAPAAGSPSASLPLSPRATACITQGIKIKGEVTGKEDLFIDGTLEGKLDLGNASVTVGPNGKVKADIAAREIVVRGHVDGKLDGTERVQLWSSGKVAGEVRTERLAIEDGAVLRGKVEAGKSRAGEQRSKNSGVESAEKAKSTAASANSQPAVI